MSENLTIAEARAAERERIKAILTDPIAQDRRQAAEALALGSSMDAAEAITLLATLEAGRPAAPEGRSEAEALVGLITSEPSPLPRSASNAKSLWKQTVDALNRENASAGVAAPAGAARSAVAHLNRTT